MLESEGCPIPIEGKARVFLRQEARLYKYDMWSSYTYPHQVNNRTHIISIDRYNEEDEEKNDHLEDVTCGRFTTIDDVINYTMKLGFTTLSFQGSYLAFSRRTTFVKLDANYSASRTLALYREEGQVVERFLKIESSIVYEDRLREIFYRRYLLDLIEELPIYFAHLYSEIRDKLEEGDVSLADAQKYREVIYREIPKLFKKVNK